MARVKSCCCGCSLRTGSLIILWLWLALDVMQTLAYLANSARNTGNSSMMGLRGLEMACIAIALYGIYERRPSFMLPYIALSVFWIVIYTLLMILLVVATSVVINSGIFDQILDQMQKSNEYPELRTQEGVELARAATTAAVVMVAIVILFSLALSSYLTLVVYSYYKQMIEGTDNTGGVIYSAPVEQGTMGGGGGGYPYPQQPQPVYPPSYGQQPGGVYPPLSEVKQ